MAIFTGLARLGRDAELRYTPDGTPVCSLSLAFSYGRKGDDGKRPTQWVDASLWGRLAEAIAEHLRKGTPVCVVLEELHIETFKRKAGGEGCKLVARVLHLELAGGGASQSAAEPAPAPTARPAPKTGAGFDDMDDDIPFE